MRDIFWNWRFYKGKLLLEKDGKIPPYVSAWAEANGFIVLPLEKDLSGFLGRGGQGKVYAMGKGDKEYAVKFSIPEGSNTEEEKTILQKIKDIQEKDPIVKRHTVNIFDIQEFTRQVTDRDTGEEKTVNINVFVVEKLQPLDKVEKKYFDDLNVQQSTFLNNIFFNKGYKGWGEIRGQFIKSLEELYPDLEENKKNVLVDAFDKARDGLSRDDLQGIYFSPLDEPTMVSLNKLTKLYLEKMIGLNGELNKIENVKGKLAKSVGQTFNTIFKTKIPMKYDAGDEKQAARMASFKFHNEGPMKSLHNAMMHIKNKYGITPGDLRQPNVMKRGDDLVVSDLGFFK